MSSGSRILVVGAGWSGAVVAHTLATAGHRVEVLEQRDRVGGHSRVEILNDVVYEPNGAHIFHTSNPEVAGFINRLGITRGYKHQVVTEVDLGDDGFRLLSWPPQVDELQTLPDWPLIERQLAELPTAPSGLDLETYVVSLMGRRLYELFIENYSRKQWGREPRELSSSFAPRRIELRRDGDRRLFHDRWEFFPPAGINSAIEMLLAPAAVTLDADVRADQLVGVPAAAIVITAALDRFAGQAGLLAWRGVTLCSTYLPTGRLDDTVTPAYVVNRPSAAVPFTRTVETKHATGQLVAGTVVSEEYPGSDDCHYPVATVDRTYEQVNEQLQAEIRATLNPVPVFFCGRLATYAYINQDQAIERAWDCARDVARCLAGKQ